MTRNQVQGPVLRMLDVPSDLVKSLDTSNLVVRRSIDGPGRVGAALCRRAAVRGRRPHHQIRDRPLAELLGKDISGSDARELQGSCAIGFSELEQDGVELFDTPGVLEYLSALHTSIPHLFYFLIPDPRLGAILLFLRSEYCRQDLGMGTDLDPRVVLAFRDRMVNTAQFATNKGDDWVPIVSGLLESASVVDSEELMSEITELIT